MVDIDWNKIRFLEGGSNIKELVHQSVGRTPSTQVANDISVCIQQGRLFFEAAMSSPQEIQPLQLYYGILGFSNALIAARNCVRLDTLPQSHGVSDVSRTNTKLEELSLRIGSRGTFQRFNDAVAELERIHYYDASMPKSISKPFYKADTMEGLTLSIKDILSRIPTLQHLFENTFGESAKTWHASISYFPEYEGYAELRIDDPELFKGRQGLKDLVNKWRGRYKFLNQWCLSEAQLAWGNSILIFGNVDKNNIDEFASDFLVENNGRFESNIRRSPSYIRIPFSDILDPMAGGLIESHEYMIQPFNGVYISEFSLQFLGSYILSSLVRYRPQVWQHAISRSIFPQSPADDRAMALIHRFIEIVLKRFPKMITHGFEYKEGY